MKTIEYYLRQLEYYRQMLITNLRELGVSCDDNETYNTLIPKLYTLSTTGDIAVPSFNFYQCDASSEDLEYVIQHLHGSNVLSGQAAYLFEGCTNMKTAPLYLYDTTEMTTGPTYTGLNNLEKIDATGCNLLKASPSYFDYTKPITTLKTFIYDNTQLKISYINTLTRNIGVSGTLFSLKNTTVSVTDNAITALIDARYNINEDEPIVVDFTGTNFGKLNTLKTAFLCNDRRGQPVNSLSIVNFDFELDDIFEMDSVVRFDKSISTTPVVNLEKLEDKTAKSPFSIYYYCNCNIPMNFPNMIIDVSYSPTSTPIRFQNLPYVTKLDLSKVKIINSGDTVPSFSLSRIYANMGSGLSEITEDNYFKPPVLDLNEYTITSLSNMHTSNRLLKGELNISDLKLADTCDISYICSDASNLTNFILNKPEQEFTLTYGLNGILYNCSSLKTAVLNAKKFNVKHAYDVFIGCNNVESIIMSNYSQTTVCTGSFKDSAAHMFNYIYTSSSLGSNYLPGNTVYEKLHTLRLLNFHVDARFISLFSNINSKSLFPALKVFDITGITFNSNILSFMGLCYKCISLESVDLSMLDAAYSTDFKGMLYGCSSLVDLSFPINCGKGFTKKQSNYNHYVSVSESYMYTTYNDGYTINLSKNVLLSHDSLIDVLNKLYDLNITYGVYDEEGNPGTGTLYTQTIMLGEENIAKLTPEEIAIATNKGWTVI